MSDYVNWRNLDLNKISITSPEEKTSKKVDDKTGQPYKHREVAVYYNYGTDEKPRVNKLLIEFPEITSSSGIADESKTGRFPKEWEEWKIMFSFDLGNEEHMGLIEFLKQLHFRLGQLIHPIRGQLYQPSLNVTNAELLEATGFKGFAYWPSDSSGEIQKGRNPTQFYKVSKSKNTFTKPKVIVEPDKDGNPKIDETTGQFVQKIMADPIPWEMLESATIKGFPLIRFDRLYAKSGNKISMQSVVTSMVVTSLTGREFSARQAETTERVAADVDKVRELEEQIAMLTAQRMGKSEAPAPQTAPPAPVQTQPVAQLPPAAQLQQLTAPPQLAQLPAPIQQSFPQPQSEPVQPQLQIQPQPQLQPQLQPQPQVQIQPQVQPQPQPPLQIQTQPQVQIQTQPQPQVQIQPQTQPAPANTQQFLDQLKAQGTGGQLHQLT